MLHNKLQQKPTMRSNKDDTLLLPSQLCTTISFLMCFTSSPHCWATQPLVLPYQRGTPSYGKKSRKS